MGVRGMPSLACAGIPNLSKASVVNVSQILTVDKAELVECTGKLSGSAAGAVRDGLHLLFDRLGLKKASRTKNGVIVE